MKWSVLVVAMYGCDGVFGLHDLVLDDAPPAPDALVCPGGAIGKYGGSGSQIKGFVQFCGTELTGDVTLPATIQTTDSPCAPDITAYCLIRGATITISGDVRAFGMRSLVLAASQSIEISGHLDVSSTAAGAGPGADSDQCASISPGAPSTGAMGGGGGGAGGSWATKGGSGGSGAGLDPGGADAPTSTFDPPSELRGGCSGAPGGAAQGGGAGGRQGNSGGAVYLVAAAITLESNAMVRASGEGGFGGVKGNAGGGGGGGGTGGLIVFDTATFGIASTAAVFANGGGGGAGGDKVSDGQPGQLSTVAGTAASGGAAGSSGGGVGGNGAVGNSVAGNGLAGTFSSPAAGGGGGGGGQGFILLFTQHPGPGMSDARFSPSVVVQ